MSWEDTLKGSGKKRSKQGKFRKKPYQQYQRNLRLKRTKEISDMRWCPEGSRWCDECKRCETHEQSKAIHGE